MRKSNTILLCMCLLLGFGACENTKQEDPIQKQEQKEEIIPFEVGKIESNKASDFDFAFVKMHDEKENKVFSPISMKYALAMLQEGANGQTLSQIEEILGNYQPNKYTNNDVLSFANALFVKEKSKDFIFTSYIQSLLDHYDADVLSDDSASIQQYIHEKTNGMIEYSPNDSLQEDFTLLNALAINMEWVHPMVSKNSEYYGFYEYFVGFNHIKGCYASAHRESYLTFNNQEVKANSIAVGMFKYDMINEIGIDNLKKEIGDAYIAFVDKYANAFEDVEAEKAKKDTIVNQYIEDLKVNYLDLQASTDFSFASTETEKVFIKDLKEYDGLQLEYIAIMPEKESLDSYISNITPASLNTIINQAQNVYDKDAYEDGVVTIIEGALPVYKINYDFNLKNDLKRLGIIDVFDQEKADLSKLGEPKPYIMDALQKTVFEFSNEGIQAAALTAMPGGLGADGIEFNYFFTVPVKTINLSFDKPFLFLLRDKKTKEIWYIGTLYEGDTSSWDYS